MWVVQEAVLSKQAVLTCGNLAVNALDVHRILDFLARTSLRSGYLTIFRLGETTRLPLGDGRIQIMGQCSKRISERRQYNVSDLLIALRSFLVTDPRDKIFGILGIAADGTDPVYSPDYTSTLQEVFIRICRHLLVQNADIDQLCLAGIGTPREMANLPTWVPDWSATEIHNGLNRVPFHKVGWSAGGPKSRASIHEHSSIRHAIVLRGRVLDSVKFVVQPPYDSSIQQEWELSKAIGRGWIAWYLSWVELVKNLDPYPTAEPCAEVSW